nr:Chain C, nonameric peptide from Melanocyte protein Pmel 17 [synthetic construct]3CC5_F Chain F, nonameric peptide from Melanocyte protein Pmel 17 [synthetic construct]
KVPRNQDWL